MVQLVSFFIFLVLTWALFWVYKSKGMLSLPYASFLGPHLSLIDILFVFLVLIVAFFVLPLLLLYIATMATIQLQELAAYLQTAIYFFCFVLFALYFVQKNHILFRLIKDKQYPGKKSITNDIAFALILFPLALCTISMVSIAIEWITTQIFGNFSFQQNAIELFEQAKENPISLIFVLSCILFFAPIFEEFIFRGCVQTYLRSRVSVFSTIFISSLIFALFHYSPKQGISNIPLCVSLFAFSLYLSFCYEKTRSLFSSIILHVTFNFINVMRMLYSD